MRTCPNDGAPMQPRTKNHLTIDVCPKCHGIFLDYGEMEELERYAAQQFTGGHGAPPPYGAPQPGYQQPQGYVHHGHGGHHRGYGHGHGGHYGRRKKKGFLSDFLD
ncbi:MAG: zf-TFIIB domain-containing protein [Corynebacteriales bacterium]|nr:zf-TFIIB domain-containing protein [Mycobacteriales bacterium]